MNALINNNAIIPSENYIKPRSYICLSSQLFYLCRMSQPASTKNVEQKPSGSTQTASKTQQHKIIEPTVNKTVQTKSENKPQSTIENNSIIKQKDNELPSLKDQSKNHKQNLPAQGTKTQKLPTQAKISTTHIVQTAQKGQTPKKGQTNQKIQTNQKGQTTQNHPVESKPKNGQSTAKPTTITENPAQKADPNKIKATTQATKSASETKIQSNKTQIHAEKPVQTKQKPEQGKQKSVQASHKAQQTQIHAQKTKQIEHPAAQTQSNKPKQQQSAQKKSQVASSKQAESSKQIKKGENTKEIKKEQSQQSQKPAQKGSEKSISQKLHTIEKPQSQQTKNEPTKAKQEQTPQPTHTQSKVLDSKKPQKQINPKPQTVPNQKQQVPPPQQQVTSFNQLLKTLIQKSKQRQQKAKTKSQIKDFSLQDSSIDLNLILTSPQSSAQYPQNRIKLQFKILQNNHPKFQSKQPNEKTKQSRQMQQPQQALVQIPSQNSSNKKQPNFKFAFYLYNLKEPKNKNSNQMQKQKIKTAENIQKKLQQVTVSLDKNLFSLKVSDKDDSQPQKNKLPLRTIKLSLQSSFISSSLGITNQRLEQLHSLLKSLDQKTQKQLEQSKREINQASKLQSESPEKQEIKEKLEGQKKQLKNGSVTFATSSELCMSEPLKNIETTKFLAYLSNGFRLRLQSKNYQQPKLAQSFFQKTLREAIFSLAPSLLNEYLTSIVSGTATIKFRSIKDLRKLLTRLGINQIFQQTPTMQQVLKDLIKVQLKSLFKVMPKNQKGQKPAQAEEKSQEKRKTSQIWKIFETIFIQARCQGLSIELTLYQRFAIRLTVESCSKNLNELFAEAMK